MKISKFLLASIILLAIITLGAVSAANDNTTSDCPTDSQNSNIQLSNVDESNEETISLEDDEIVSQNSTGTHNPEIKLSLKTAELIPNQELVIYYSTPNWNEINGNLSCYIDDEIRDTLNTEDMYEEVLHFDLPDCGIGNHTFKAYYSGDNYFRPFNQTLKFEITSVALTLPEMGYNYIEVIMPEDATGNVTININGTEKHYDVDNIKTYHKAKGIYFSLADFKYGDYNLELTYAGNYGNITKKANITKDYEFWINNHGNLTKYIKNNDVLFFDLFYDAVSKNISVLIDGVNINYDPNDNLETNYNRPLNWYDGMEFAYAPIWLKRISMSEGYHTLEVRYAGDKTHPAKTITEVFYLNKPRLAEFTQPLINSNYPIEFIFPKNTTGNISVYTSTDGKKYKLFATADITNNRAKINIPCTKTGKKYVKVIYNTENGTGQATTSFNVVAAKLEHYTWIEVEPYFKYTFTLKSGKKVTGTFSIYINNKLYKSVKITKQTTKITMPTIYDRPGKNTLTAKWKTNYGTGKKSIKVTIAQFLTLKTVKVKKSAKKLTLQARLSIYDYPIPNKQVTFKFNGKTYKAKANSNGVAKVTIPKSALSKLKVGKKVTYQATYLRNTIKKTVKVQK